MDHGKMYPPTENPPSYDNIGGPGHSQPQPMQMPMPMQQNYQQPTHHQPQVVMMSSQPQFGFQSGPVVITQQPTSTVVIHPVPMMSSHPSAMVCPHCRASITTSVRYEPSCKTHFFAGLICFLGCFLGCCLIPYCVEGCQSAIHKCPSCNAYLGQTV